MRTTSFYLGERWMRVLRLTAANLYVASLALLPLVIPRTVLAVAVLALVLLLASGLILGGAGYRYWLQLSALALVTFVTLGAGFYVWNGGYETYLGVGLLVVFVPLTNYLFLKVRREPFPEVSEEERRKRFLGLGAVAYVFSFTFFLFAAIVTGTGLYHTGQIPWTHLGVTAVLGVGFLVLGWFLWRRGEALPAESGSST